MRQAKERMQAGRQSQAQGAQQQAEQSLEDAAKALEAAASEQGKNPEIEQQLKTLSERQEDLRKRLKELDDLLKQAENPEAQSASQSAKAQMEEAEDEMEQGEAAKAEKSAEEARKYLEQMKEQLENEKRRYQSLQQEELLIRLLRDLKEARTKQAALRKQTAELVEEAERLRTQGARLSRARRKELLVMSAAQDALATTLAERLEAVQQEKSTAFAAVLEEVVQDMQESARMLKQPDDVGQLLLGIQDEVIHRIDDLVGGFEDELERRQQESQGQPPEKGKPGKPPLVPMIVELKLLRRQQQDLNVKVQRFWERNPAVGHGEISPDHARLIERLYHQQGRLTRALEELVATALADR
jgi:hypothetical protein